MNWSDAAVSQVPLIKHEEDKDAAFDVCSAAFPDAELIAINRQAVFDVDFLAQSLRLHIQNVDALLSEGFDIDDDEGWSERHDALAQLSQRVRDVRREIVIVRQAAWEESMGLTAADDILVNAMWKHCSDVLGEFNSDWFHEFQAKHVFFA